MIAAERTCLILLAAGQSRRFGDADKLEQEFLGHPLGMHVVTALEGVPFLCRVAVVSVTGLDYAARGFTVIRNEAPDKGMSSSVKLGVEAARKVKADAVVIALADMPRLTATHVYRLFDAADSSDAVVASSNGEHPTPPALFGSDQFEALLNLDGDEGARDMVLSGKHVVTTPAELVDIDTPEALEKLREQFGKR